jgi:hypothetical protein
MVFNEAAAEAPAGNASGTHRDRWGTVTGAWSVHADRGRGVQPHVDQIVLVVQPDVLDRLGLRLLRRRVVGQHLIAHLQAGDRLGVVRRGDVRRADEAADVSSLCCW